MAKRYDHPRLRAGLGYRKVGFFPVAHHIPEAFCCVALGWAYRIGLGLGGFPPWLVVPVVAALPVIMLAGRKALQKRYSLPDEPLWHDMLALLVLDSSFALGFLAPWPNF